MTDTKLRTQPGLIWKLNQHFNRFPNSSLQFLQRNGHCVESSIEDAICTINDIFFHNFHSLSHSKSIYLKKIRINFLSQRISIIDHQLSWHKILVYLYLGRYWEKKIYLLLIFWETEQIMHSFKKIDSRLHNIIPMTFIHQSRAAEKMKIKKFILLEATSIIQIQYVLRIRQNR